MLKNKDKDLKLPQMSETIGLLNSLIRHQPENSRKRGRKRHNVYRKSLWYKSFPQNVYEPRIVPKFYFQNYSKTIQKKFETPREAK